MENSTLSVCSCQCRVCGFVGPSATRAEKRTSGQAAAGSSQQPLKLEDESSQQGQRFISNVSCDSFGLTFILVSEIFAHSPHTSTIIGVYLRPSYTILCRDWLLAALFFLCGLSLAPQSNIILAILILYTICVYILSSIFIKHTEAAVSIYIVSTSTHLKRVVWGTWESISSSHRPLRAIITLPCGHILDSWVVLLVCLRMWPLSLQKSQKTQKL